MPLKTTLWEKELRGQKWGGGDIHFISSSSLPTLQSIPFRKSVLIEDTLLSNVHVAVCLCVCVISQTHGTQRTPLGSWFSPSTLCNLENKLRVVDLGVNLFTYWAILSTRVFFLILSPGLDQQDGRPTGENPGFI